MLPVTPVQNTEGGWGFALGGVTADDLRVPHGTTWWIASRWTKTLPRVKWVPNFKVECGRLGYVDDLTEWTHGRCNDGKYQNDVWDIVLHLNLGTTMCWGPNIGYFPQTPKYEVKYWLEPYCFHFFKHKTSTVFSHLVKSITSFINIK